MSSTNPGWYPRGRRSRLSPQHLSFVLNFQFQGDEALTEGGMLGELGGLGGLIRHAAYRASEARRLPWHSGKA